jgi:hypothetical protein
MPAPAVRQVMAGKGTLSERTVISMRFPKGLLVSLVAAGLAGCSGGASGPPAIPTPTITATASSVPPASPSMKASAHAAAEEFYGLYTVSHYAALWNMLAPATKRQISRNAWIGVHEACSTGGAGKSRVIKAVTVFGNAAIVAETIAGIVPAKAEDVFNYTDGGWRYTPQDPSIYQRGSVTADIGAAKAAGLCTSSKIF